MKPYKLLIIEDDEPFVKIIDLALRGLNFDYDVAPDGETAIEKLADAAYDLVISDFRLPKTDGIDVLKIAHDRNPNCKKILVTAANADMLTHDLGNLNLLGFLQKPLSPLELRRLVKKHFN